VWGHLASRALDQQAEGTAAHALRQATALGLSDADLLTSLADQYAALGRFQSAADLLARAAAVHDSVEVRVLTHRVLG
jgi:thioredoxin-like negative regulator of GroEL